MKQPKKEHIIRRLLWEARPIWKWLLLAALLCIGVIVCGVLGPKLLGGLIDRLYAWWDGSDRSDLLAGLLRPMGAGSRWSTLATACSAMSRCSCSTGRQPLLHLASCASAPRIKFAAYP